MSDTDNKACTKMFAGELNSKFEITLEQLAGAMAAAHVVGLKRPSVAMLDPAINKQIDDKIYLFKPLACHVSEYLRDAKPKAVIKKCVSCRSDYVIEHFQRKLVGNCVNCGVVVEVV